VLETKRATIAELWRRGQHGWPERFPVAQFPNPPLLLAFAGWGCAATTDGTRRAVGRAVFVLGAGVWAWEEALRGTNWFRRSLGLGALAVIVARAERASFKPGGARSPAP
jgi:hypothetical protein